MGTTNRKLLQHDSNLETYSIIWLDSSFSHNSEEFLKTQQRLRTLINHLKLFEDVNQCEDYIRSISSEDRLILIINDRFSRQIIPRIEQLRQVSSIYIHSLNKNTTQQWAEQFLKVLKSFFLITNHIYIFFQVKIVTDQLDILITRIESDHKIVEDLFPVVIFNTNEMNSHFICSQLLINCLLRTNRNSKNEFLSLCKNEYKNNENELNIIHEFEQNYSSSQALSWYTRKSFIYRILNKALQIQNIDLLFILRFFLQDIYHEIKHYQCLYSIHAYRNHLMTYEDIQLFQNSIGQFLSINSFLSASLDRGLALYYLYESNDLERVLFEIDAESQSDDRNIFGNINYFQGNEQILFMLGSIFQLENISFNDDGIWIIQIKLCTENHSQLKPIFNTLKTEYHYQQDHQNLFSFGQFLLKQNSFNDEVEKFYLRLLNEYSSETKDRIQCYDILGKLAKDRHNYELSIQWFNKSIQLKTSDDKNLIENYNHLAEIYQLKNNYKQAIQLYDQALIILIKIFGDNHPKLTMCLNNIAIAYKRERKYHKAIECHQKALMILEKYRPMNHVDLAVSHNNIGVIYRHLGQYDLALKHYEHALEIYQQSFLSTSKDIARTFRNLGIVYEDKSDLKQALLYYNKVLTIYQQILSPRHSNILAIEQKIQYISSHLK